MENHLRDRFVEAKFILLSTEEEVGSTVPLQKTKWVRIVVEKDEYDGQLMNIIVEITPPSEDCHRKTTEINKFDSFIIYIEYLKKLREISFDLDMIVPGCICCASMTVGAVPEDNIFRVLVPP